MSPQLLAMLRSGQQPLDAYAVPHLVPRVAGALSRVLQTCHAQYAGATLTRCCPRCAELCRAVLIGAPCCPFAGLRAAAALLCVLQTCHAQYAGATLARCCPRCSCCAVLR